MPITDEFMKKTKEIKLEESVYMVDLNTFSTGEAEKLIADLWSKGLIDGLGYFDKKNNELKELDLEMERCSR
jgi:hypothetical protein